MIWIGHAVLALVLLALALLLLSGAVRAAEREAFAARVDEGAAAPQGDALQDGRAAAGIRNPVLRTLYLHCAAAGIRVRAERIGWYAALMLVAIVLLVFGLGLAGLLVALAAALLIGLVVVQRRRMRRRRINAQLPNFLGYLVRALTAGNTLEEGIHSAASESAEPIRGVFLSVSRQIRLGASVEDTLGEAAAIHELRALHILAMSARVNRRYGGSMRRVIASLIDTIRQQEGAARELKALTGETRFSAYVVAAIPIAISAFFYLQNPQYYATMLQSGGGRIAVLLALLLEALGLFIIWRMMARLQEPEA